MDLPKILIIDDQYGGVRADRRNREREDLCFRIGLQDVTGDVRTGQGEALVAEAVFCRGQVVEDGQVRNDLVGTIDIVREGWRRWPRWALLFLDMQFRTGSVGADGEPEGQTSNGHPEGYFGMTILEELWRDPALRDIPVVILSAMPREQIEHRFVHHGVFDFVDKNDLTPERLDQLFKDYGLLESDTMIGRSVAFLKCLRDARQRAKLGNDNILLLGEPGTGKELVARYVHAQSPRSGREPVTVYTQGVPETLVDDRIFGHERGAYTGAKTAEPGAAENADRSTLFIDEFGDIPASIQAKLLRLLDKNIRESQRLGAKPNQIRHLDLQVVLATNQMGILDPDPDKKDFRRDLLSRVNVADPILLPPLRDRREDIPPLVEHFVRKYERAFKDTHDAWQGRKVEQEAMRLLCEHDWRPGNVRDLERVIESAVYRRPKLRVLSTSNLRLPASPTASPSPGMGTVAGRLPPVPQPTGANLVHLLSELDAVALPDAAERRAEWAGKLPQMQTAFARAAARLLRASLLATRKPTPQTPDGEIKIHPAVKLAMGDAAITASQAADIVKRVLSIDDGVHAEAMRDPILRDTYEKAVALRPKGGKRRDRRRGDG